MPITTKFSPRPNRLPNPRSLRCKSAGTRILDIQNDPSPISGHVAADRGQIFEQIRLAPTQLRQRQPHSNNEKLHSAVSDRYPQCGQSCRSRDPLVYSLAHRTRDPRARIRLESGYSIYKTNLIPFPGASLPIAAGSPRGSAPAPPGLYSTCKMHDTGRLMARSV